MNRRMARNMSRQRTQNMMDQRYPMMNGGNGNGNGNMNYNGQRVSGDPFNDFNLDKVTKSRAKMMLDRITQNQKMFAQKNKDLLLNVAKGMPTPLACLRYAI